MIGSPPLQVGELVDKPCAFAKGAIERGLQLDLLRVEALDGSIGAAIDFDDCDAQIVFGFARDLDLAAQMRKARIRLR